MSVDGQVRSTGVGSWPGTDLGEALRISFAECPDLPYLPELPARGPHAELVGRGTAFLAGLDVDLQPAGWRLADASGRDHRRARALLRSDLDQLEEQVQGYAGPVKLAVAGPWTLAAQLERPRGDRVVGDAGARRDLGQSLLEGIVTTVDEVRRRLPDVAPLVQLDEPSLPAVLSGALPTASGLARHRALEPAEIRDSYTALVEALGRRDTRLLVHSCAAGVPVTLLHEAGVGGLLLDLDRLGTGDWDALGGALEAGMWLGLGALPTGAALSADEVAARALRPLRALGLDPAVAGQLLVSPACGLAGLDPGAAVRALRSCRTAAEIVTDELAG